METQNVIYVTLNERDIETAKVMGITVAISPGTVSIVIKVKNGKDEQS